MRTTFVGDIHMDLRFAMRVLEHAREAGSEVVFSAGDFGYWPHIEDGPEFIESVDCVAADFGITVYWIDGNHENHDAINMMVREHGMKAPIPTPATMGGEGLKHVLYVPRGCVLQLGDTSVMGFGGAASVDRFVRVLGLDWWPSELITEQQVWGLEVPQKVDILVTHEVPESALDQRIMRWKSEDPVSVEQTRYVEAIARRVNPGRMICGHYHVRACGSLDDIRVDILAHNYSTVRSATLTLEL